MQTQKATFAAGCFWGTQETFRHLPGVLSTRVGYIGGNTDSPTYQQVCSDTTGHAEAVEITYQPTKISYAELLDAFWSCHDPTTLNRQGPDEGTQYRSAIFYHNAAQQKNAHESLHEVTASQLFQSPIVTQIIPATQFHDAEEYHQHYFTKNGGTCHMGITTVKTKLAATAAKERQNRQLET